MASSAKNMEPAFQGAGQRIGMEIWRIENFLPVPLLKSDHGKFYSGDSYIILQTSAGKGGTFLYDIHFWIGKDTSQDEAGTAAIKTVELDAVLGGRAVQHRELQGYESDKFLSYFKPCIIPLEGGIASGFKKPEEEKFETRLYVCKGRRVVRLRQVPFARSSLNHDDVFIMDTESKIYQFNGANSNIQERAKALEVIQYLKEKYHEGKSDVAIIDDGKLEAESDSGEFWVFFGGFAPIGRKTVSEDDVTPEATPAKLYSINDGQLKLEDDTLTKAMLENSKCYLLDCGAEIFVWVGRITQVDDRKSACKTAEELIANDSRPKSTRITRVIQGCETHSFKSNFETWPVCSGTGMTTGEEGRGKVAALLKQQGVDVKGSTKGSPINEEIPPLLEAGGKLEVWRINGSAKSPLPEEDIGKFYSGDCYIVLYTYHLGDKKEEYFLSCWMGKDSIEDDQIMATRLASTMCTSLKGRPVLGRIFQGRESPQFIALFQPMVVLKGGISSGYKNYIIEKNLNDDTYKSERIALFRVSGTSVHNNKVVQVDAVATSLCSADCFLLQSGNTLFNWHGSFSTFEQQQWAAKLGELLKPGVVLKQAKEGTESSAFWFTLGGKQSFTTKKVTNDTVREPHLYTYSFNKGKLQVAEVFNFSQDDLLTEDILILNTHAEVFVWVGQSVGPKEMQEAVNIGHKYIELAAALEGLSPDVPLYKVSEGNEPCFFTTYFSWDGTKATVKGNSFQKKLSQLFGSAIRVPESHDKSNTSTHGGPRQRAEALAALTSAFNPASNVLQSNDKSSTSTEGGPRQRAEALAALTSAFNPSSNVLQSNDKLSTSTEGGPRQRAEALAALTSAFNPSSNVLRSNDKLSTSTEGGPRQRAEALAALTSAFNPSSNVLRSNDKLSSSTEGGPRQRAEALAALTSAFNPSRITRSKSYDSSQGGYTQRAEALAALSSAFNPSSREKTVVPKPARSTQGSQRAAAVAALSNVLTAEQEREQSEAGKGRLSQGSSIDVPASDEVKSEVSMMGDVVEEQVTEDPLETSEKKGTWEDGSFSENNGMEEAEVIDDSETIDENEGDAEGQVYSYERLKSNSSNPVKGINYKQRETYLFEDEFETVFGMTKEVFYQQPKWKQEMLKRKLDLF